MFLACSGARRLAPSSPTSAATAGSAANACGLWSKSMAAREAASLAAGVMVTPFSGLPSASRLCTSVAMLVTRWSSIPSTLPPTSGTRCAGVTRAGPSPAPISTEPNSRSPMANVTRSPAAKWNSPCAPVVPADPLAVLYARPSTSWKTALSSGACEQAAPPSRAIPAASTINARTAVFVVMA